MKTIQDLKKMISQPASKEWFEKHGLPKSKALHAPSGKVILKKPRMLTEAERKEKTKDWPTGKSKALSAHEKHDYQKRVGRSYDD